MKSAKTIVRLGCALLVGSAMGCKASTEPGPTPPDATIDADNGDAGSNESPVNLAWQRFDNAGAVRHLSIERGTEFFMFDFAESAGVGSWVEPLDLEDAWAVANAPFENSTAPLDAAWYRYDDTQGGDPVRKLNVIRGRTLFVYDYGTDAWTNSDLSTDTNAGTGWASPEGPFANNNPAPIDAAWYRFEQGQASERRLTVIRGTRQFTFDYATGQWSGEFELTNEGNTWVQPNAPFASSTAPIDAAWYRYEGTGENKVRLLGVLRGTTQFTYNFLAASWNPVLDLTDGSWAQENGPFAP